jgi:hypothetical protein
VKRSTSVTTTSSNLPISAFRHRRCKARLPKLNVRLIECLEKAVGEEEQDIAAAEPAFAGNIDCLFEQIVTNRFAGVDRSDFGQFFHKDQNAET